MPSIHLRLLLNMYTDSVARILLAGMVFLVSLLLPRMEYLFKQGGIVSPILHRGP